MSEQQPQEAELSQELRELGELFKRAVRVARENPNMKEFETRIAQAIRDLNTHIDRATQSAREPLEKAGSRVKQVAQTYRETGAPEDIARGFSKSAHVVGEQIRKVNVKNAAQAYKESGASDDFAHGLAKSVRLVNDQIRKAIDEIEKK
jgi:methyl-accepting chemotaxis protein